MDQIRWTGTQRAVEIINSFIGCNIDPRGDLQAYFRLLKELNLRDNAFSQLELTERLKKYKEDNIKLFNLFNKT